MVDSPRGCVVGGWGGRRRQLNCIEEFLPCGEGEEGEERVRKRSSSSSRDDQYNFGTGLSRWPSPRSFPTILSPLSRDSPAIVPSRAEWIISWSIGSRSKKKKKSRKKNRRWRENEFPGWLVRTKKRFDIAPVKPSAKLNRLMAARKLTTSRKTKKNKNRKKNKCTACREIKRSNKKKTNKSNRKFRRSSGTQERQW